jgi:aminoglycoside phosphotransferase
MTTSTPTPPTPGRVVRRLIICLEKASRHKILRRFLAKQTGLPHIFNICIKTRQDGNLSEAFAMQFVASHTSIPVPKIYYAFTYRGTSYIVMRHIKGEMAAHGWSSRSDESKGRILKQLGDMVAELRSVPSPKGAKVGSVDGGPFYDCRLPSRLYWGPYDNVHDFHKALVDNIPWDADYANFPGVAELFAFYRQAEYKLVLTHGDLSSLNILVRGDNVVAIVDWETAGWFPAYWEYTTAKYVNPHNPFWADSVDQFIAPMPEEWRMESIRRRYFGDV